MSTEQEELTAEYQDGLTDEVAHKLLNTTDAQVWAQEFMKIHVVVPRDDEETDVPGGNLGPWGEDVMIGWFANAIETGRNAGRRIVPRIEE